MTHYYLANISFEFDLSEIELDDLADELHCSDLCSDLEDSITKGFSKIEDTELDSIETDTGNDSWNGYGYLYIKSSKTEEELKITLIKLLEDASRFDRCDEFYTGSYSYETHGLDYGPYERVADTELYKYTVWANIELEQFVETNSDFESLDESVSKNELKDRAEKHSRKQHGLSPFCSLGESSYKSGDRYYGELPAEPDYTNSDKKARYWKELIQYFKNTVSEHPEYSIVGSSPVAIVLRTPNGKETVNLTRFDALADANEAIEMASHYFDASLSESKKKKKTLGGTLNTNAGNVEHNIAMFNQINSPVEGPCNNPISGPFGGDVCAESLDESRNPYFTPYGYKDAAKVLNGKAPEYYYHLKEIEMDQGDGEKLARYARKLGLPVVQDPDDDPDYPTFYILGKYHWNDYFYPYPSNYEPKVEESLMKEKLSFDSYVEDGELSQEEADAASNIDFRINEEDVVLFIQAGAVDLSTVKLVRYTTTDDDSYDGGYQVILKDGTKKEFGWKDSDREVKLYPLTEEASEKYEPDDGCWEDMDEAFGGIRAGSQESTKVFIDSTDDSDNFVAVKVTTAFTTYGDFNPYMFDDGAPVLKYFYRGGTSHVSDVKIPKNSWLVVSPWYGEVFRFNGKGWIMLQDSPSDIQEFTTYNEEDDDLQEGEEVFMEKYSYGHQEEYKREPKMIDYFEQMNREVDDI